MAVLAKKSGQPHGWPDLVIFNPKIGLNSLEVVLEHQLDITMALLRKTVNQVGVVRVIGRIKHVAVKTERVV